MLLGCERHFQQMGFFSHWARLRPTLLEMDLVLARYQGASFTSECLFFAFGNCRGRSSSLSETMQIVTSAVRDVALTLSR